MQIREDTVLKNFPLYCPKCKQESLIEAKNFVYNSYQRARRKDAEPITRRFEMRLSALSFLTTYVIADRLQLIKPLLVGKLRLQH